MALGRRLKQPSDRAANRYTLAAFGVFIAWAVLMIGAVYALLTNQPANAFLPPLERVAHVVTIMLLGWAFLTADHETGSRGSTVILVGLIALVIIGYLITGMEWASLYANEDFTTSSYGTAWTFIAAVMAGLGILLCLLYFRLVHDAPLKVVFFAVLLVGYVGTLIQIVQGAISGDYAGLARLAFLGALIIWPAILYRMIIGRLEAEVALQQGESTAYPPALEAAEPLPAAPHIPPVPVRPEPVPVSAGERDSVQLMRALGIILESATPENIPERIVAAAMDVLKADVGALLSIPDPHYADIVTGQDKVMNRTITSISLNLDDQPTLVNALERRAQRPLYTDRNVEELHDLYTRLDIEPIGPAYFQPLVRSSTMLGVLMLGLPYSNRELSDSEQELLKGIGIIAAHLLALSNEARESRVQAEGRILQAMMQGVPPEQLEGEGAVSLWQEMRAELDAARDQIVHLSHQVTGLKIELDYERSRVTASMSDTAEGQSISERIVALNEEQLKLKDERDRLSLRLREAETALAGALSTDNEAAFKSMVESLRREREELLAERDRLQQQLAAMRETGELATPLTGLELLDDMSEEKQRLEAERDQMLSRLEEIQGQLKAVGIQEGTSGLTQLVSQLFEQTASLQSWSASLQRERDALLAEREQLEQLVQREQERERQIQLLQTDIKHLASDREAATKQREKVRAERDDLNARLEALKQQVSRLMAEAVGFEQELTESHEEQKQLREQIRQAADERSLLAQERDRLLAERQALETERDQLMARVEGDRERLQQLGVDGVGSLTRMIEDLTAQRSLLERELNETQAALGAAEDRLEILTIRSRSQPQVVHRPGDPEVLLSMVQELRTPMTSIIGYVDLLLGESPGILGEMQRKFLQRVSANVTRLTLMLDDLIRISFLDAGEFKLMPESVDVIELIEDAITGATNQLREKGLTVHMSLDDDAPPVRADRDAISQIIGQLLTNAYLASPPRSEIFISARTARRALGSADHQPVDCLYVSVEDRGGGIAIEDQPRVFARKYKAENPLIQGLGDTGVGLAIAKALVEAHGGEIWMETQANVGSRFNVALPLEPVLAGER